MPARVAVPLPLSVNVTPDGRAGLLAAEIAAVGLPVVRTVNEPCVPAANVAALALVMAGAAGALPTVSVKAWVALGFTPFAAVMVIG